MHTLSCGLLICLAASGAQGHGDDQPTQQVLRAEPDGTWRMFGMFSVPRYYPTTYTFTETVPVTVPTTVEENGQTVTKNITKYQVVQKQGTRMECVLESYMASSKLRPDSIKAFETDGRKISQADLQRRIKGDTLVVVSNNGKPISNHYLSIFKPGTIVLVEFEAEHAPAAPGAAPPGVVQPVPQPLPVPNPPVTAPPQARSDVGGVIRPVAFQPEPTPRVVPNNDFPKLPASPAPEIVFLSRDGSDAIKVRQFRETQAPLTVRVGDKGAMKDVQATRTTRHSDTTSLPWNAVQISAEGKDLPLDR